MVTHPQKLMSLVKNLHSLNVFKIDGSTCMTVTWKYLSLRCFLSTDSCHITHSVVHRQNPIGFPGIYLRMLSAVTQGSE